MKLVYKSAMGKVLGTTEVVGGVVQSTGCGQEDVDLAVVEPGTLRRLRPADGDAWLRGLQALCRSGFVSGVLVP